MLMPRSRSGSSFQPGATSRSRDSRSNVRVGSGADIQRRGGGYVRAVHVNVRNGLGSIECHGRNAHAFLETTVYYLNLNTVQPPYEW